MQKVLHTLYDMTPVNQIADISMVEEAICQIIGSFQYTYSETLFRMPEKQKELLIAITKEGKASAITSGAFGIKRTVGKGFRHARGRNLSDLRPFLRIMASKKLLNDKVYGIE